MSRRPRVVVVGSSNTDLILQVSRIPRPGETVLGGVLVTAAGGKGANQAVAAARAGGAVTLVARIGQDAFGDAALSGFERDGVDIRHVRRDRAAPSGVALILVGRRGENSIAVASGANACLSRADVVRAKRSIASADALLLQLETPLAAVEAAARLAADSGVPVILNPAPAPARPLPRRVLRLIDVLTPNETEAELLSGVRVTSPPSALRAASRLREQGARTVIVTLGARGAVVLGSGVRAHVPAFRVRAVDTVAAGDVLNGALAVALADGRPLLEALRFATAAAAISVTRVGAQPSAPRRSEVERFLRKRSAR